MNQKVAVATLSGAAYRVDTALNGKEAFEAVARRRYDAILMDCQMPELNGYEATSAIRAYEDPGPYTPIIALTAGARPTGRVRCLTAGMDDYLTKPVSKEALLAMVASHMEKDQPATGTLDEEVVAELEALDGETLSALTTLFFENAVEQLSDLSGAVDRGEAPAVGQMAHRLKGSSCTVGAANVSRLASELETTAMAGDLTTAEALLDQLDVGLDDARGAFLSRA